MLRLNKVRVSLCQINGRSCHRFKLPLNQSKFLSLSHPPDRQHGQPLCCRFVSMETLHTLMPGWTSEKPLLLSVSVRLCILGLLQVLRSVLFLGPLCFWLLWISFVCLYSGYVCTPHFCSCSLFPDRSMTVFCDVAFLVVVYCGHE